VGLKFLVIVVHHPTDLHILHQYSTWIYNVNSVDYEANIRSYTVYVANRMLVSIMAIS